jgi:hypothetical protein
MGVFGSWAAKVEGWTARRDGVGPLGNFNSKNDGISAFDHPKFNAFTTEASIAGHWSAAQIPLWLTI